MNIFKKLPQVAAKVIATGAILVAASMPMALSSSAGALTLPGTLTGATAAVTTIGTTSLIGDAFAAGASGIITVSGAASLANDGGNVTITSNAPGVTFSGALEGSTSGFTVKFASSATTTTPGTYSLSLTDNNGAATGSITNAFTVDALPTLTGFSTTTASQGQTIPALVITGTGFNNSVNTDTNTNAVAKVTISNATNGTPIVPGTPSYTSFAANGNITSTSLTLLPITLTSTTATGSYNVTLTNKDGGSVTYTNAITVGAQGLTNVSPSSIVPAAAAGTSVSTRSVALTGSGFQNGAVVTVGRTSYTGGAGDGVTAGVVTPAAVAYTNPTLNSTVTDSAGILPAGTFVEAVTAGTSFTLWKGVAPITVSTALQTALIAGDVLTFEPVSYTGGAGDGVTAGVVTPNPAGTYLAPTIDYMVIDSAGILPAGTYVEAVSATTFTLYNGVAPITVSTALQTALIAGDVLTFEPVAFYTTTFVSSSEIDGTLTTAIPASVLSGAAKILTVTVTNPSTGGGNGVVASLTGGLGFGVAAAAKPTIVSVTAPTAALVAGAATASTVVINGYGFDPNSTEVATFLYAGSSTTAAVGATADGGLTSSCTSSANGQTLTCSVTANSGVFAGLHGVLVQNTSLRTPSSPYISAPALNVDGPSFSSITPSTVPAGSAIGTTIAIAGSGLNNTLQVQADPNGHGGTATGIISTVSPTSATFALSAKPAAGYNWITADQYSANGALVWAQPISFVVTGLPTVTATADANNPSGGIGAGAQSAIVVISGTGFKTGAKVASFTNVNGTADTGVTATFVKVNVAGTALTVAVTVASTDTNISDGFTVTNTDGGSVKVVAFGIGALVIDNGPTISAVTPATATGGSTTSFTITGTNFSTDANNPSVVSTTGNGTCGTATVVSHTSITVSCTFGVAGATASSLVVTNPDDGSATSAAVLAAAKPVVVVAPTKIPAFNVAFAKGSAVLSAAAKAALTTFVSSVTDGSSVTITAWGTTGALATARVAAIAFYINNASDVLGLKFHLAHGVNKTLNKGVVTETIAK